MTRTYKTLIGLLVATLFIGQAMRALDLFVLCVAEGHVEIELALDGQCGEAYAEHHDGAQTENAAAARMGDESHCGVCVDIPFAWDSSLAKNKRNTPRTVSAHKAASAASADLPRRLPRTNAFGGVPGCASPRHLKTLRLLI